MNHTVLKRFRVAIAFVVLASSTLLIGQKSTEPKPAETASPPQFSASSNLVLVSVVVTNKQGQHVSGLRADDFEVLEDDKAQKIAGFEEIVPDAVPVQRGAVGTNSFTNQFLGAHPKKLEIILLDLVNTPFAGRAEALRGLTKFLAKSSDSGTLVALMVLRSGGVRMIHNFTADTSVLTAALHQVQAPSTSRDSPALKTNGADVDAEARQLRAIFAGQQAAANGGALSGPALVPALNAMLREQEALSDASKQDEEALLTLKGMQEIARYFAAVPGRKSLLWASTGFRFSIGTLAGESTRGTTPNDWQRTVRLLQDANIAVYPVDLAGVGLTGQGNSSFHERSPNDYMGLGSLDTARLADPTMAKHLAMDTAASMTGGQAFYNFNDSDELFRRTQLDSAQYYTLAYYAKVTANNGWRKLRVRIHRHGVSVRARSGFYFGSAVHEPDATRQQDEMNALTSALESTSLPFSGEWQQVEVANDQRKVHFTLTTAPGAVLVDAEHENSVDVDFLVYAWDSNGKKAAEINQTVRKKLSPTDVAQAQAKGIDYTNVLTLMPGEYDVHIVVRDNLKGSLGSIATPLTVP